MNHGYIDFISAYCDRWCERCAFTSRCSAFAAEAAIAMCGDFEAGLELAVGRPHQADGSALPAPPAWVAELNNVQMTPEEAADYDRRAKARDARVDDTSIMKIAWAYALLSHRWLTSRHEEVRAHADDVLREALEVALHDSVLVTVKLSRALHGRDEHQHEGDGDDDPVQNDWNGSAKVSLISIERSENAWRTIADATGDETPALLADQLHDLRAEVEQAFPHARSFIRPGFDEHGPCGGIVAR